MRPTLLIGAPGTGKTYRLVQKILELKPSNFALVSFTRRAANEAKQRLKEYYPEKDLKWVRTIHSMCFELLGLKANQVLKHSDLLKYGSKYGYEFTFRNSSFEDGLSFGLTEDDIEYRNLMIAKSKLKEPDMFESGMLRSYLQFKIEEGLFDFNDMIYNVIQSTIIPPKFDLLCVDEIQDLTPLQLQFIFMLFHRSTNTIFAGDGDQMIFEWAGVDRKEYLDLEQECDKETLQVQYRIPQDIFQLAQWQVHPSMTLRELQSNIEYINQLPEFNPAESYLVLGRNNYLIKELMREYDEVGFSWTWLNQDQKWNERNKFNILASTIHGAKGAEADNVIILSDVSPATYEQIDTDAERRVWYVGLTRPKSKLYILEPRTEFFYELS